MEANGVSLNIVNRPSVNSGRHPLACPSIQSIIATVCEQYDLSFVDLCGNRRSHHLVVPRHIAFWLCKQLTMASYPGIGRMFNNRDHTSIMHGARKIQKEVDAGTWIGNDALALAEHIGRGNQ